MADKKSRETAAAPAAASKVMLVNRRQQPVELHLGDTTCVLLPGHRAEVSEAHLKSPQLAFLIARKAVSVAAPQPAKPAEEVSEESGEAAPPEPAEESSEAPGEAAPQPGTAREAGTRRSAAVARRSTPPASPSKGKPA